MDGFLRHPADYFIENFQRVRVILEAVKRQAKEGIKSVLIILNFPFGFGGAAMAAVDWWSTSLCVKCIPLDAA